MPHARSRDDTAARSARDQADAHEERFHHRLDGLRLLTDRDGEGVEPHRSPVEAGEDGLHDRAVQAVETQRIHVVQLERGLNGLQSRLGVVHERIVAHAAQEPVRDARRAPRTARDLGDRGGLDDEVEQGRGTLQHEFELGLVVELQMCCESEAISQRIGQEAGSGGRRDQGERREIERDARGAGPLAHHDVDPEVLHREVEHLLGRARHAVDLVDEQHLAGHERRQHRRKITGVLDGRAARHAQRPIALGGDDHRQGRLAETRRSGKEDVVGRAVLHRRGLQQELQLAAHLLLPDELGERARTQRALERELGVGLDGGAHNGARAPSSSIAPHRLGPKSGESEPQYRGHRVSRSASEALASASSTAWSAVRSGQPRPTRATVTSSRTDGVDAAFARLVVAMPSLPGERDDDELGGLGADAGDAAEGAIVLERDGLRELGGTHRGQHAHRALRSDAGDPAQQIEHREFVGLRKAVERQIVFADDQSGVQPCLTADPQAERLLRRHLHGEPDAADLHDHGGPARSEHHAAHGRDHAAASEARFEVMFEA